MLDMKFKWVPHAPKCIGKPPSISDIRKWVKEGYSQSPRNCKIMLDEISRLQSELAKEKKVNRV